MIELLVLDVDGTMTSGGIIYSSSEESDSDTLIQSKEFNVKDGLAIATWTKKMNKKAAIITGRTSSLLKQRAKDLGITHLYQGVHNKHEVLNQILEQEKLTLDNVAAIGDDLNDYKMLAMAKLSFCPADASEYICTMVHKVCKQKGGEGAIREMVEYIFKLQNQEEEFLKLWQ